MICKSSVCWDSYEGMAPTNIRPLAKSEILSLFPELPVLHRQERPVRERGVARYSLEDLGQDHAFRRGMPRPTQGTNLVIKRGSGDWVGRDSYSFQ